MPPRWSRSEALGVPSPPLPPAGPATPPAFAKFAEFSVSTRAPSPPRTVSVPATVNRPLHSHTIGLGPVPRTSTPCGIVTLLKLKTPPVTENGDPVTGTICVNAVFSTTSAVVGA